MKRRFSLIAGLLFRSVRLAGGGVFNIANGDVAGWKAAPAAIALLIRSFMLFMLVCLADWSPASEKQENLASTVVRTGAISGETLATGQARVIGDGSGCGALCFDEPYSADGSIPPMPASGKRGLSTQMQKVDVGFIVDTTGSMGGEIIALRNSLSLTIIPALQARIPSLGIGIAAHDDVPYSTYGDPASGDKAFYFPLLPQGYVTMVTADSQLAANALITHNGLDLPESQVLGIYKAITGAAITWPTGSLPPDSPPAGTFGAMHFRSGAFPIVINITDASHHNGKRALDKTGTNYDATFQNTYSFATWNVDNVVTAMNGIGAKFVGVASDNGVRALGLNDPYGFSAYITDKTNSNLPPSAFTPGPGCVAGECCTGLNGAGVTPDGPSGTCRSVWSISTNGTGLGTSIVNGVVAILNTAQFDVYVLAYNDPAETTDVVGNFMLSVEPDPTGGTDPVTGEVCVTFPPEQLADNFMGPKALIAGADGVPDTITDINPAPVYCFKVTPKPNTVIPQTTTEQTFRAWLRVLAIKPDGTITLGPDREVRFIVPTLSMATSAASRKTHSGAGNFDIPLPLTGNPGVECRSGGGGGDHTFVITFNNAVVSGNAAVTGGIGSVDGTPAFNNHAMTVSLTGVADVQTITVTLSNVTDSFGQVLPNTVVSANMLIGDTTGNKTVNASDVAQTKAQSGAAATGANFRTDINASGTVTASDIAQVKANAGHNLP